MTTNETSPGATDDGEELLLFLLALVGDAHPDPLDELLDRAGRNIAVVHQARRRCLTQLEEHRAPNTKDLLQALDVLDEAVDRLEASTQD